MSAKKPRMTFGKKKSIDPHSLNKASEISRNFVINSTTPINAQIFKPHFPHISAPGTGTGSKMKSRANNLFSPETEEKVAIGDEELLPEGIPECDCIVYKFKAKQSHSIKHAEYDLKSLKVHKLDQSTSPGKISRNAHNSIEQKREKLNIERSKIMIHEGSEVVGYQTTSGMSPYPLFNCSSCIYSLILV